MSSTDYFPPCHGLHNTVPLASHFHNLHRSMSHARRDPKDELPWDCVPVSSPLVSLWRFSLLTFAQDLNMIQCNPGGVHFDVILEEYTPCPSGQMPNANASSCIVPRATPGAKAPAPCAAAIRSLPRASLAANARRALRPTHHTPDACAQATTTMPRGEARSHDNTM